MFGTATRKNDHYIVREQRWSEQPAHRLCPEVIKLFFFMPNSAEHEIFTANKYENANNSWHFSYLFEEKFSCSAMFSKKEFAIFSNLRFFKQDKFHAQLS